MFVPSATFSKEQLSTEAFGEVLATVSAEVGGVVLASFSVEVHGEVLGDTGIGFDAQSFAAFNAATHSAAFLGVSA